MNNRRLNILLTLASRTGIEALIGHLDAPTQYTRFLCYTYVNWGINFVVVLQLPSTMKMVKAIDKVAKRWQAILSTC